MAPLTLPPVAVALPGTGSDADFAARAFTAALSQAGVRVIAVDPDPRRVVDSYWDALNAAAARHHRILAAGISIGAAVALDWAAQHPGSAAGVLAALPAWTGDPRDAPAAASAAFTAQRLRADGLEAVIEEMVASSPGWLGIELARSWRSQWPHLPRALDEAARYDALTEDRLAGTPVPVGICAAVDDAVHPIAVARQWVGVLPHAALETVTLDDVGADPAALGRGCLAALARQPSQPQTV
ncbi:alpha/beta fold hydrolase [Rhodococcus sp. NPDC058505]|uniref:alpha/beta fold hydrolase n=1 Tax=unclassified Rhodococcus (in: high G+C Gram-positive bacteria) TaxID=192944 RepID=UPI0036566FEF